MKKRGFKNKKEFDSMKITLASPDRILEWSNGEITKAETINYRTQRPEKDGLFDEKVFGPANDFQCSCGRYKGIRYQGIVCEKCSVEVTRSAVRRERMGHIELAAPISHIWYLRKIPSQMSTLLGVKSADLQKVIYFAAYIVISVDETKKKDLLKKLKEEYESKSKSLNNKEAKDELHRLFQDRVNELKRIELHNILTEKEYIEFNDRYGSVFKIGIGSEAVYEIFRKFDMKVLEREVSKQLETAQKSNIDKINKRLYVVKMFNKTNARPEWMFLKRLPIIPPGLRPMIPLDGGRYASSDINDLYRRVINRNNRLKRLIDTKAPDVILRNEKRILQEAVDALIDSSIKYNPSQSYSITQSRKLKSISEYLVGKQGSFRSNLLGKRVDYSGRSVIIVGPELKLDQCGIPKTMALELFKPFVISKLIEGGIAHNIKTAGRIIDDRSSDEVWAILESIVKDKYVLLNRQPTLHRQGIQAFKPILVEGSAIRLHPLVCSAFNADFDGDQMAVHVPLSEEAQMEAKMIMNAKENIVNPGTGKIIASPSRQDIILGCYWVTTIVSGLKGEGKSFPSVNEAITAWNFDIVDLRAKIYVLPSDNKKYSIFNNKPFETSVGRLLFNSILPDNFDYINEKAGKNIISDITERLIDKFETNEVADYLDKIKDFGFHYATMSGISWSLSDVIIPKEKDKIIEDALVKSNEIYDQYEAGLLSLEERRRKNIEIWQEAHSKVKDETVSKLKEGSSVYDIIFSGSRGNASNLTLMAGMKGIIAKSSGAALEQPVLSSVKEGHNSIEYFMSTYGTRKGLTDTALRTAGAGYLTRRLFDAAQEVKVEEEDCRTTKGFHLKKDSIVKNISFANRINGRVLQEDIKNVKDKVIAKRGDIIEMELAKVIEEDDTITKIKVRSPLTCLTIPGICRKCYGKDLSNNKLVGIGEPVGIVAAQSIGEPGTQLTMRTSNEGGVATVGGDITAGLPRVEELFERRIPTNKAVISHIDAVIESIEKVGKNTVIILNTDKKSPKKDLEYVVPGTRIIKVKVGEKVEKGQIMTDGSLDLVEYYEYTNEEKVQDYILAELEKVYNLQGISLSPKHFEILISQMFSRVSIVDSGDSEYTSGSILERAEAMHINKQLKDAGKEIIKTKNVLLGVKNVSLTRNNFLSAASFENTTKILINAAIRGAEDTLSGLKENVIVGRIVPIGTGFKGSKKQEIIETVQKDLEEKYGSE